MKLKAHILKKIFAKKYPTNGLSYSRNLEYDSKKKSNENSSKVKKDKHNMSNLFPSYQASFSHKNNPKSSIKNKTQRWDQRFKLLLL